MTLGAGAESSQNRSHVTTIIKNFTQVGLVSTTTPHSAKVLFRATVCSHLTHVTIYFTLHYLHSRKIFPAVGTICALPTY